MFNVPGATLPPLSPKVAAAPAPPAGCPGPNSGGLGEGLGGGLSFALFRWALATTLTRQNEIPVSVTEAASGAGSGAVALALIPGWDMLNHSAEACASVETSFEANQTKDPDLASTAARGDCDAGSGSGSGGPEVRAAAGNAGCLVCRATRALRRGEEVHMFYGPRPTQELLVYSGFVPDLEPALDRLANPRATAAAAAVAAAEGGNRAAAGGVGGSLRLAESLVAFKLGEGVDEGGGEKQLAVSEKLRPYPHDTAHLSWRLDLIPPPGPPAAGQAGALAAGQAAGEAAAAAAALVKTRVLLCRALDLTLKSGPRTRAPPRRKSGERGNTGLARVGDRPGLAGPRPRCGPRRCPPPPARIVPSWSARSP